MGSFAPSCSKGEVNGRYPLGSAGAPGSSPAAQAASSQRGFPDFWDTLIGRARAAHKEPQERHPQERFCVSIARDCSGVPGEGLGLRKAPKRTDKSGNYSSCFSCPAGGWLSSVPGTGQGWPRCPPHSCADAKGSSARSGEQKMLRWCLCLDRVVTDPPQLVGQTPASPWGLQSKARAQSVG